MPILNMTPTGISAFDAFASSNEAQRITANRQRGNAYQVDTTIDLLLLVAKENMSQVEAFDLTV